MDETVLTIEKHAEGYAVLTLNRPRAMNALSRALRAALAEAIDQLEADPAVRVLIVTGAGRAFCAGLDLKELGAQGLPPGSPGNTGAAAPASDPKSALDRFSGPIIGAINGAAITGGFELALACDVLIASTEAKFADTHARVGVMPGWGLSQKLSRVIGIYRARELSLTGNFLSAQQASEWGLVNRVVAPEDLMPQAIALAQDMLSTLPHMLPAMKKVINDGYDLAFGEGIALERARASAVNGAVKPEEIEQRRAAVRERAQALAADGKA
jgi:enoyl-CoA hydratase